MLLSLAFTEVNVVEPEAEVVEMVRWSF